MLFRGSFGVALVTLLAASSAVAAPLLNVAAAAAPVRTLAVVERDNGATRAGEVRFNITYQSNHTAHLPKTLIMATGCARPPPSAESDQFFSLLTSARPRELSVVGQID